MKAGYTTFIPWLLQVIAWLPTRLLFGLFGRFTVVGREHLNNLPTETGVIFAANHASEWDPILVRAALPWVGRSTPLFFVSLEKAFYQKKRFGWRRYLYGGGFFKAWGAYPAYLGTYDYDIALAHHIEILKGGESLCIFPEGSKTKDGNLREGKAGVGFLVDRTDVPVVPVLVEGVFRIRFRDFFLWKRCVRVTFGKPLSHNDIFPKKKQKERYDRKDYKQGSSIIMKAIGDLL